MTVILRRTLSAQRRQLLGWVIAVVALSLVTIGSWPAFKDESDAFSAALESIPAAFTAFLGEGVLDFSAAGLIGSRLFGSIGLALFIGFAISRGARAIAGEEGDGTLELLVTKPWSRVSIAVQKVVATWVALAGLVLLQMVVLLLANPLLDLGFAVVDVVAASTGLYTLAIVFGMGAFAVGAASGNRSLAVGLGAGLAAALFVLTGLGGLIDSLSGFATVSPFTHYDGTEVLVEGVKPTLIIVFALTAVALAAAGIAAFDRRDLA